MTVIFRCRQMFTEKGFMENAYLVTKGGTDNKTVLPEQDAFYDLDGTVTPPFINAHTHLELTDDRQSLPYEKTTNLWNWILDTIKYKRSLSDQSFLSNLTRGEWEIAEKGSLVIGDVRSVLPEGPFFTQLKGIIFFEVLGYTEELFENKFALFKRFLSALQNNKNLKAGISIHSLYTIPFSKANELVRFARQHNLPIMIHLAETSFEDELFFNGNETGFHKIFPEAVFENKGFKSYSHIMDYLELGSDCFLVHCVNLTKEDWEKVKERNINVVFCPKSNQYWGDKLPDFERAVSLGINFHLGTDSKRTNENTDMLEEARFVFKRINKQEVAKALFSAITVRTKTSFFKDVPLGIEPGDVCSFLFFPEKYQKELFFESVFAEKISPLIYYGNAQNEHFSLYKK